MSNFLQGFLGTQQAGVEARNDVTVAIRNWFANRNPLVTRLPYVPVERVDFLMYTHKYRARSTTLGDRPDLEARTTGLVLADSTFLMNHDVLQLVDSATGNTRIRPDQRRPDELDSPSTCLRGVAGTTPLASVANGSTVNLIGNSRNGAEVNQTGLTTIGVARDAVLPDVPVPGADRRLGPDGPGQVMPGGIQTPFDFNMTIQLQNMVDDIENSCYYGSPRPDRRHRHARHGDHGQDERPAGDSRDQQHAPRRSTRRPTARPT